MTPRRWGTLLLMVSVAAIGFATLTPGPDTSAANGPSFWCVACGTQAGADITSNIVLFLPFGAALALLGVTPVRSTLVGLVVTCAVETAQHLGVVSLRTASITDVMANTIGAMTSAWFMAHRAWWFRPAPRRATILSLCAGVLVSTMLSFTAWALSRAETGETAVIRSPLGITPGFGWFHGRIASVEFNGTHFSHEGNGPLILQAAVPRRAALDLLVDGRDERSSVVPIVYVHGVLPAPADVMVAERGESLLLRVNLRGGRLRLALPELLLPGAFANASPDERRFHVAVDGQRWRMAAVADSPRPEVGLPITLGLGWSLFQTLLPGTAAGGAFATVVWLAGLFLPVGYWLEMSRRPDRHMTGAQLIGAMLAGLTLILAPLLAGIARTPGAEVTYAGGGVLLGALLAHVVRRGATFGDELRAGAPGTLP